MIRTIVIAIGALFLGALAAFYVVQGQYLPQLDAARLALESANKEKVSASDGTETALARAERLEKENADVLKKLDSLNDELNRLRALANDFRQAETQLAALDMADLPDTEEQAADSPEDEDRRGRDRGPWGDMTDEERETRRQEFRTRMQESAAAFFDEEFSKAASVEMQERLAAIEEYGQYFMDGRQRMRDAETDEQREALQQDFARARGEMEALMDEQRADMLRNVAARYGVSEADQAKFVRSMERTVESPFFRGGGFTGGRGGGSWGGGGGWGGGRGGGDGGRGGGSGGGGRRGG